MTTQNTTRRSTKTEISKSEYFQLIGLRAVADRLRDQLDTVSKAALEITKELDPYTEKPTDHGHTDDYMWDSQTLDTLLDVLGLTVVE